jgi:UDP-N-acetylmuramoyl-tripeptide--D-alanyl-D-alanine ligase
MIPLTLRQIRHTVGGKAITIVRDENVRVMAVCLDTRKMVKNSLFVAIRGENHDAHQFLKNAAAGGAIAMLVEEPPAEPIPNVAIIQVPSTRLALGRLAKHVRQQLRAKVIVVAGSNGKTSTKHLIHGALRGRLKGSISPKSFNNDIGVPLTILSADPQQEYLVLEVGTNHHGEIKPLSEMAMPDIAVLTNCGADHLEGLGDLAGVRRENAQITSGLNPKGLLIVNGDDTDLLAAVKDWTGRRITFGFKESNDIFANDIRCTSLGTEFSMNKRPGRVFVPMLGKHSAANALAAIAVGRVMRLPEEAVIESLAKSDGPEMRLELQTAGKITILNDAYNANPNSMRAAIETLVAMETKGRRIAVLGDMLELGETSEKYHREIGSIIASTGKVDLLACVGADARWIAESAAQNGLPGCAVMIFDDAEDAAKRVPRMLLDGDWVLIKASRGIHLEQVANALSTLHSKPDPARG